MDSFSPIVITSRIANKHFNDIRSQHGDIVKGMQDQALRVSQFNADKEMKSQMEMQQKRENETNQQKLQMDAETKRLEQENKQRELEIKQAALAL